MDDVEWYEGDWCDHDRYERFGARPGRIFVFGKYGTADDLHRVTRNELPRAHLRRPAIPSRFTLELLRRETRAHRAAAFWVGDLDPFHIAAFLAYRRGGPLLDGKGAAIGYLGIDDRWLALLDDAARKRPVPKLRPDALSIPLDDFERDNLDRLSALVDLETIVGPRCAALLRSGRKLELEAVSADLHGDRFVARLASHLAEARPTV